MKKQTLFILLRSSLAAVVLILILYSVSETTGEKKRNNETSDKSNLNILKSIYESDTTKGETVKGGYGYSETVSEIMKRELKNANKKKKLSEPEEELVYPDRRNLPQNPSSPRQSGYPNGTDNTQNIQGPQTVGINFTGATLLGTNPTLAFPADDMGAVGPTQYIIDVNGRIVTFSKTTGIADGVMNTSTNNFYISFRNGSGTSDPRIRYDRITGRWFLIIINVSTPNRILIAVSNSGTITAGTTWTFFFIPINSTPPTISNTCLMDYPTLGIDVNALYIGGNNFCGRPTQTYNSTDGYVVKKSSILGAGPIVVTVFRGLVATPSSAGPYTPQGVDNFDTSATEGYFIGVDNLSYGTLQIRRVSTPGGTPTISSNITLTVNTTAFPLSVNHLGNTGGTNGKLDAIDDRLFSAVIRNGRLWTSHNIGVDNTGSASGTITRTGSRWYEIQNMTTTPSLVESGTIFKSTSNNTTDSINYWIPSVMISGQGHVAVSISAAGTFNRINSGTVGRLATDPLGTMGTPVLYTSSTTAYNPPSDPGTRGARRWGDYSYVSLDPNDDMTMWGVHGFCDSTNSYGVRIGQFKAPPPATPSSANPSTVPLGVAHDTIVITGTSTNGSGFFDPGSRFPNRISATVTGNITVNSVIYNNPTQVTLDINTISAITGSYSVTITNPDGQSATGNNLFNSPLPVELSSFNGTATSNNVTLKWTTVKEINNAGFDIERKKSNGTTFEKVGFVTGKGNTYSNSNYVFSDNKLSSGVYNYRLKQTDYNGDFTYFNLSSVINISVPDKFSLSQNYPNPFNPTTKIDYNLPTDANVSLKIYDVTGRLISTLVNEKKLAGYYTKEFDAVNIASGVYFYRLQAGSFVDTKRFVVIK
jgi:hypothetical protein